MSNKLSSAFRQFWGLYAIQRPDNWRCYQIADGKIAPPHSCEINAVDHCNIACVDCNHASPAAKRKIADPDTVFRDLSILSLYYKSPVIKIVGGEPLLHPDMPALIKAVRRSGISRYIRLVTNGILLPKMKDELWEEIDEIELSVYPQTESLLAPHMAVIHQSAKRHKVMLVRYFYENFRVTFSTVGTTDSLLTHRIYTTCRLARLWGCQSVHEGYFFKCPQSIYIPNFLDKAVSYDYRENGIKITGTPDFSDKLKGYLSSREPLRACCYCLGSVGRLRVHRLAKAADWKSAHSVTTEELVDYDKLCRLDNGKEVFDINKIRTR
jgi:MoaA/NifB/PqqE/SkfB family radical SAM enzyme